MGAREPGQVRNQAAINGNFYVLGILDEGRFLFLDVLFLTIVPNKRASVERALVIFRSDKSTKAVSRVILVACAGVRRCELALSVISPFIPRGRHVKRSSSDSSNDVSGLLFGGAPEPTDAQDGANEKVVKKRSPRKTKKASRATAPDESAQTQPSFGALFESNPLFINATSDAPAPSPTPEPEKPAPAPVETTQEQNDLLASATAPATTIDALIDNQNPGDNQVVTAEEPLDEKTTEPAPDVNVKVDAKVATAPEPVESKPDESAPVPPRPAAEEPAESSVSEATVASSPSDATSAVAEEPDSPAPESHTATASEPERATSARIATPLSEPSAISEPQPVAAPSTHNAQKSGAYQVVARRYRPQTFSELIGQETAARALTNAIASNRVGHAYLFTGARGVGKTSCARIFAKALNCVHGPTTTPCLKCESCVSIASGEDVDVLEIDGASNRGVDEIRQLRQNAAVAPSRSLYKIYIIDEVHMLTREAFNALLKTLEEPPERVKFIFCTTEPNKLPITILSRCQRFDFNSIGGESISSRLAQIASEEGAQAEPGVFDVLARRANGSMRDAQSLLEQLLSFAPNYISLADVRNMIGSVDDKTIFDILDATLEGNAARVFETVSLAGKHGVDFGAMLEQILGVYRDLMVVSSGCGPSELLYSPMARYQDLQKIANAFGIKRILASLQILDQTAQRMRFSAQTRVLVEIALARLCRLDGLQALETLITQLKRGSFPQVPMPASQASPLSAPESPVQSDSGDQKKNRDVLTNNAAEPETNVSSSHETERAAVPANQSVEQPVPASPKPRPAVATYRDAAPEWLDYSSENLATIWSEATNAGVILPAQAQKFAKIVVEKPRNFVVVFSAANSVARDYCEGERDKIRAKLVERLQSDADLRLIVDPSIKEAPTPKPTGAEATRERPSAPGASPTGRSGARLNYRDLYRTAADSEVGRQIIELFEAELADVKAPYDQRRKDR